MPRPAGIALAALAAVLLVGCGGNGNPTVAKVGGESITQKQLDAVVTHFRSEAQREGKSFPRRVRASGSCATACWACSSTAPSYAGPATGSG